MGLTQLYTASHLVRSESCTVKHIDSWVTQCKACIRQFRAFYHTWSELEGTVTWA